MLTYLEVLGLIFVTALVLGFVAATVVLLKVLFMDDEEEF